MNLFSPNDADMAWGSSFVDEVQKPGKFSLRPPQSEVHVPGRRGGFVGESIPFMDRHDANNDLVRPTVGESRQRGGQRLSMARDKNHQIPQCSQGHWRRAVLKQEDFSRQHTLY